MIQYWYQSEKIGVNIQAAFLNNISTKHDRNRELSIRHIETKMWYLRVPSCNWETKQSVIKTWQKRVAMRKGISHAKTNKRHLNNWCSEYPCLVIYSHKSIFRCNYDHADKSHNSKNVTKTNFFFFLTQPLYQNSAFLLAPSVQCTIVYMYNCMYITPYSCPFSRRRSQDSLWSENHSAVRYWDGTSH